MLNFRLNSNLEGFSLWLDYSKQELYFFGGKKVQGDCKFVKVLDISNGVDKASYKLDKQGVLDQGK